MSRLAIGTVVVFVALAIAATFLADVAPPPHALHLVVTVPADVVGDVYIAGSSPKVGSWNAAGEKLTPVKNHTYECDVNLPPGTTLEFKFTRGSWDTVEKSADGSDRPNRTYTFLSTPTTLEITVERFADATAPTSRKSTVTGHLVLHDNFASKLLHNTRKIWVWLPPGFDAPQQKTRRYPVLYMQDGRNCFDEATASFGHEWNLDESAKKLIQAGEICPLIIVAIDHAEDRTGEYAGEKLGRGETYARFVADELKPFIDHTYPTLPTRENTAIGGSSLGALAALAAIETRGDTFGAALIVSPSVWFDNRAMLLKTQSPTTTFPPHTQAWIDIGTAEGTDHPEIHVLNAKLLRDALKSKGVTTAYEEAPAAQHNEQAWSARVPRMLKFLYGTESASTRPAK